MTENVRESDIQAQYYTILAGVGLDTPKNREVVNERAGVNFSFALHRLREAGILNQENFNLIAFHENHLYLASTFVFLHRAGILSPDNRLKAISNASRDGFTTALKCMTQSEILNQENFNALVVHPKLFDFSCALLRLDEIHLLNQARFELILTHTHPCELAFALANLHEASIHLSEEHRARVFADAVHMSAAIQELCDAEILNQEYFNLIATHPHPENLALILGNLQQAGLLNAENQSKASSHAHRINLATHYLLEAGMLNQENFDLLISYPGPQLNEVASALIYMNEARILTSANRTLILTHQSPVHLSYALRNLDRAQLLNQHHFNQLVAPEHVALLSDGARAILWERLASHHLLANWERIVLASRSTHPLRALEELTNLILGVGPAASAGFNPSQSTHTASVHRTVSKSAINLMRAYGHLNLETSIKAMGAELASLDDGNLKQRTAKRAFSRLVAADYAFVDSVSGVSTRQLLALVYLGLHDDRKRLGLIADAKRLWIDSLYEVQRGYNLNESGVDDGALEDRPICVAGTFNKLLEALNGIHVDVEIFYLSKQSASAKFQKLAQQEALRFLKSLAPKLREERILELKEYATLEPIWKDIEGRVRDEFWAEFKELYDRNMHHRDFVELLHSGIWCHIPDLEQVGLALPSLSGSGVFGMPAGAGAGAGESPSESAPKL